MFQTTSPYTALPVHRLAQCLAELTGLRDRDQLQARLVQALTQGFVPRSARLCRRPEGQSDAAPWLLMPIGPGRDPEPAGEEAAATLVARHEALSAERRVLLSDPDQSCRAFYPLVTDRGTDAVLELEFERPPDESHHLIADQLLKVYRNLVGLLDYSERDSLTGLLNRKTFDETFMRMSSPLPADWPPLAGEDGQRHWQSDDPCWLAVIDVDHFKQVNDRYGHLVGDEVLLLLAQLMNQTFRHRDRLYRFGGEEFVVLMRCGHADGTRIAMERLRERVQAHAFPQIGQLTLSAGFTCVQADDTPEQAFGRADKAVYAAKARGRNQVCEFAELVADGAASEAAVSGGVDFF